MLKIENFNLSKNFTLRPLGGKGNERAALDLPKFCQYYLKTV